MSATLEMAKLLISELFEETPEECETKEDRLILVVSYLEMAIRKIENDLKDGGSQE